MTFEITGHETADELIKLLVAMRHLARCAVKNREAIRSARPQWEAVRDRALPGSELMACANDGLAKIDEHLLELRFAEIEVGCFVLAIGKALDAKAAREAIFDALNVGIADRRSDAVAKHGDSTANLIFVLNLENSATESDDLEIRPLAWCCQRFFMNQMEINPAFDRSSHDMLNETFNGAFGEYRERPLTERLAGRSL